MSWLELWAMLQVVVPLVIFGGLMAALALLYLGILITEKVSKWRK